MDTVKSDMELIHRIIAGDIDVFGALVSKYHGRIFRLNTSLAGNREDAADLTQETFIKAFRGLSSFRGESNFYTWLYRIALNTAIRARLRQQRLSSHVIDDSEKSEDALLVQAEAYSMSPLQLLEEKELLAAIEKALAEMPEQLRSVLTLRLAGDLSYIDIAEVEDIPINTVRSRLSRARKQLAFKLAIGHPQRAHSADHDRGKN